MPNVSARTRSFSGLLAAALTVATLAVAIGTAAPAAATTYLVTATIPVGDGPQSVAVSPDGTTAYVADAAANAVSVLDLTANTLARTVSVGLGPYAVAVSPHGTAVYVTDNRADTVSVLEYRAPVTVTFEANGGTGAMAAQTQAWGTTGALAGNTFTFAGHAFAGWNTAADGSGTAFADGADDTFDADVTLYAQWAAAPIASLALQGPAVAAEGDTVDYTVEGVAANGDSMGDVTGQVRLTSNLAADTIVGARATFGFDPAAIGGSASRTLTASLLTDPAITASLTVEVSSAVTSLRLDAPATAAQGDTVTVAVEALDSGGRVLGGIPDHGDRDTIAQAWRTGKSRSGGSARRGDRTTALARMTGPSRAPCLPGPVRAPGFGAVRPG